MKDKITVSLTDALSGISQGAGPWMVALMIFVVGYFVAKSIVVAVIAVRGAPAPGLGGRDRTNGLLDNLNA